MNSANHSHKPTPQPGSVSDLFSNTGERRLSNEKLRQRGDSIYEFWGDCCGGLAIFFWVFEEQSSAAFIGALIIVLVPPGGNEYFNRLAPAKTYDARLKLILRLVRFRKHSIDASFLIGIECGSLTRLPAAHHLMPPVERFFSRR
jgi:hypothetical protein